MQVSKMKVVIRADLSMGSQKQRVPFPRSSAKSAKLPLFDHQQAESLGSRRTLAGAVSITQERMMSWISRASLAAGLTMVAVSASAQGRAATIEDYYRSKVVGAPQLSPNGKWVAFTVTRRIEVTNGDSTEVWLTSADNPAPRRVSRAGTHATAPDWVDGRLIFSSGGRRWTVDPAMPDSLVESGTVTQQGALGRGIPSRDGQFVASLRPVLVPPRDPVPMSEFEKRHMDRFRGRVFDWLNFQSDGAGYPIPNRNDPAVNPAQELWIAPAAATPAQATQITRLGLRPNGLQWSPDGTALLFTADSGYRDERRYPKNDVYLATRDGQVRRLTADPDLNYTNAQFSPDGRRIMYMRQLSSNAVIAKKLRHGGPQDLAVIPAAGGPEKLLTGDWDYLPFGPRWSPDGNTIFFTAQLGGTIHLLRVSPDGGPITQVTTGQRRIQNIDFDSAFTRIAYNVGTYEAPFEVWTSNVDGSNERQLTHVNDSLLTAVAFSKSERILYRSKDGTPVEGWLMYPYGYRADGGPYPLAVSSHGGPHSADGYGFDFKDQYFAANGYFVLQTNFRSSTGYGEKFLWATWGAWGDKDGEDVMAGIDHVIARYPIARNRVATMGHSYGGFMTNWLITQYPDRFAAAISGAGPTNWTSDYGNADIPVTKEKEFLGAPWDSTARAVMIRQSPLFYADRARTPTLFVSGELDERVPYSEVEQMYVALKKNGVPAKMMQYQGQSHGIGGHWNLVIRMMNDLRWLDTYLKATGGK
jgi:dipeptidyl aminopeptidase/acylaminoacyl peptidase